MVVFELTIFGNDCVMLLVVWKREKKDKGLRESKVLKSEENVLMIIIDMMIFSCLYPIVSVNVNNSVESGKDDDVGEDQEGEAEVEIPNGILIKDTSGDPIDAIINAIYPDVVANLTTPSYFEDRAILAPTNDVVNKINERMMKLIPIEERVYLISNNI
uniref:Uncharacterized protein n=1 Tax=Tanacetum cinerariifolium TaxID=118510 RepID=A0A699IJ82_TANCI|nr:hypothetical protein [Tanacetum cinerariifolium]